MATDDIQTHYRACHICEALCGLKITTQGDRVLSIQADDDDVMSHGHICPKGVAIQDIHTDPDRLRQPMERRGEEWFPVTWDYAFDKAAEMLAEIAKKYGPAAIGVYGGNPAGHASDILMHSTMFAASLGTPNWYSASTQDQLAMNVANYNLYGHQYLWPIPDIDHTQYFFVCGGDPMVSNGSFMTVPDFPGRIKKLKARGGRMVVIDPRRSETAKKADEHHFIRPGSDPFLLLAMIRTLFARGWVRLGRFEGCVDGLDELRQAVETFTPERAETMTGIPAAAVEQLAHDLAHAESAVCYGRIGTCCQEFGSISQWAIQLLNLLTGNLDRVGGALPTHPAAGILLAPTAAGGPSRARTRVRGLQGFGGSMPGVALAEEILTPGPGQIKAMVTYCGNPVSSVPNGIDLERGFSQLEYMVSVDFYINETTRNANLILPPVSPLERGNYDVLFLNFAVRNYARYYPPIFAKPEGGKFEWEIYCGLIQAYCRKMGREAPPQAAVSPEIMLDHMLKSGFYPELSVAKLAEHPHGLDLGPLKPSLKERLATDNGHVKAASEPLMRDIERLQRDARVPEPGSLLLVGRRNIRSMNSWLHNSPRLVKGPKRHYLLMHPQDMKQRDIADGSTVTISSHTASVKVEVKATDDVMPGVVSLPHGLGQRRPGVKLRVASKVEGVSFNDLADGRLLEPLSGSSVLTGIPVSVKAA